MRFRVIPILLLAVLAAFAAVGVLRAQKPFREYPGVEYTDFALPTDWKEPHDWVRARLKYVSSPYPYRAGAAGVTLGRRIIRDRIGTCCRECGG